MLIGIVSKDEHIKNHAQALRKDGYSVVGLGSSPTEIPPTVDLIILRTQSCSHGGSDTAFSWSRSTNKPLIVENGLSGIRTKLRIYAPNLKTKEPSMLVESTSSPNSEFSENTPTQKVVENNFFFPTGSETQYWNAAVPTHRAKRAFQESLEILKEIPNELREQIAAKDERIKELEGWLKPFADCYNEIAPLARKANAVRASVEVEHLRTASRALEPRQKGEG